LPAGVGAILRLTHQFGVGVALPLQTLEPFLKLRQPLFQKIALVRLVRQFHVELEQALLQGLQHAGHLLQHVILLRTRPFDFGNFGFQNLTFFGQRFKLSGSVLHRAFQPRQPLLQLIKLLFLPPLLLPSIFDGLLFQPSLVLGFLNIAFLLKQRFALAGELVGTLSLL